MRIGNLSGIGIGIGMELSKKLVLVSVRKQYIWNNWFGLENNSSSIITYPLDIKHPLLSCSNLTFDSREYPWANHI